MGAAFQAQRAGIQGDVVILGLPPLHVGIESVIGGPAFVLVLQPLFRGKLPFPIDLNNSLCPEIHVRMEKDLQAISGIPQDVVRTAADNNAGFLLTNSVMTWYWIFHR